MENFELHLPAQGVIFGAGRIGETGNLCRRFGSKCLVALGTGMPLPEKLKQSLRNAGIAYELFEGVVPNPHFELIDEAAELAKSFGSHFVIGIGGGSAMDTAKGIAVAATHEGSIWPYAIGEKPIENKVLPIVTIPTTSGTGSHCTQFSVISNNATKQKPGMGSGFILPSLAIVDPEMTLSMPRLPSFFTGFDVLAHGIEAYTSKAASPLSDIFAEKAITLAAKWLPKVWADGSDLEARAGMALADTCAGIAISHAVVSLGHVLAHVLGGHYPKLAHGDALYSIYREILAFNSEAMAERHAFIANALRPGATDAVEAYEAYFRQFDAKGSLKRLCAPKDFPKISAEVFTYMKGVADLNPRPACESDVRAILEKALAA